MSMKIGDWVELNNMHDPHLCLQPGDRRIVFDVAPDGVVGVRWNRGFRVSLVPDVGCWRVVDTYLTPYEAVERLGLTVDELEQLIDRGQIRARRLNSGMLRASKVWTWRRSCAGTMTRPAERP